MTRLGASMLAILAVASLHASSPVAASAPVEVAIDFDQPIGPMEPRQGYLVQPSRLVADGRIVPMKMRRVRDGLEANGLHTRYLEPHPGYNRLVWWGRQRSMIEQTTSAGVQYYPMILWWPEWSDWTEPKGPDKKPKGKNEISLKQLVKDHVQFFKDNHMNVPDWDVWNEMWGFDEEVQGLWSGRYLRVYKDCWEGIKEVDPNANVAGPSNGGIAGDNAYPTRKLMDWVVDNGYSLDIAAFHEGRDPRYSTTLIRHSIETRPEAGVKRIFCEEYMNPESNYRPIEFARYLGCATEADLDWYGKSIWEEPCNNLSDILDGGTGRKNIWWIMKAYAELGGVRVRQILPAIPPTPLWCPNYAIGSRDTARGEAKIFMVLGAANHNYVLRLLNQPFAGMPIRIDKYKVTAIDDPRGRENDGLTLIETVRPASTENLELPFALEKSDEVWLIVVKKEASAPGDFCLKTPDDGGCAPPNATVSWQPASGATGYTLIMSTRRDLSNPAAKVSGIKQPTYTVDKALMPGTKYYWTVTADNEHGSSPAANAMKYTLWVTPDGKGPTRLIALDPPIGCTGIALKPTFSCQGANGVTLLVDENEDFSNPVIKQTIGQDGWVPEKPLKGNTKYYWKVMAGTRGMDGPSPFHFTTRPEDGKPAPFEMLLPADGTKDVARRAYLKWGESNGACYYTLEIADNKDFSSPVLTRRHITYPAYTVEPDLLAAGTRYYWRVTAHDYAEKLATQATGGPRSFVAENRPCPPLLMNIVEDVGRVTVRYRPVKDATGYRVWYGTEPGKYTAHVEASAGKPCEVAGLKADGTKYYFAVVALKGQTQSTVLNEKCSTASALDQYVKLTGSMFGSEPAAAGQEYKRAIDWDVNTFFLCKQPSGGFVGIDLDEGRLKGVTSWEFRDRVVKGGIGDGSRPAVNKIRFYPRGDVPGGGKRMQGGRFQGSNASRTEGYTDLYVIKDAPADRGWTEVNLDATRPFRYLRYVGPDGSHCQVAEIEYYVHSARLRGKPFRVGDKGEVTASDWSGDGAHDGNYWTSNKGNINGIDFGEGRKAIVNRIKYSPGRDFCDRMKGAKFQGSNTSPTEGFVDLYTVPDVPPFEKFTEVWLPDATAYRYVRIVCSYFSEAAFYGTIVQDADSAAGGKAKP